EAVRSDVVRLAALADGVGHVERRITRDGADIVLELPARAVLSGAVLTPSGEPAAGAWVTAYRTAGQGEFVVAAPRLGSIAHVVRADEQGRFAIHGLEPEAVWTIVAAALIDGAHCNATTTGTAGGEALALQLVVQSR